MHTGDHCSKGVSMIHKHDEHIITSSPGPVSSWDEKRVINCERRKNNGCKESNRSRGD